MWGRWGWNVCGGVQGIGGCESSWDAGGTPGNRKHMPASHYLHYFHIIIQYDMTIISTIIFRGCESSWDTGAPGNRKHMPTIFVWIWTITKTITKQILLSQFQCWTPGNSKHLLSSRSSFATSSLSSIAEIWVLKGSQKVYQRTNLKCKSLSISN